MDRLRKVTAFTAILFLCYGVFGLCACERDPGLSTTAKSVFFTDKRPFDINLISEDIDRFTRGLVSSPENSRLLVARGFIYAALNEFDRAIGDLELAAEINPNTNIAVPYGPGRNGVYYLLALAYWQSGKPEEAIYFFSKVLDADPRHSNSYFYRGMAKLASGNRPGAILDVEEASKLFGNSLYADTLRELGGEYSGERLSSTYITCFLVNQLSQGRPFGYTWEIRNEVGSEGSRFF